MYFVIFVKLWRKLIKTEIETEINCIICIDYNCNVQYLFMSLVLINL